MNDTQFHALITATLAKLADALESAYESGALEDVVPEDGVLTITTANRRIFVVSKHGPTQELWLASPLSGGLHFTYEAALERFQLKDGRFIEQVLQQDLADCGVKVML